MRRAVFAVLDSKHHTEEWTYADHGKEMKEVFELWPTSSSPHSRNGNPTPFPSFFSCTTDPAP
jgi:hypothetical protein